MGLFLLPFAIIPWMLLCAAAGVVAVAGLRGSANYIYSGLIGAVIGIACGFARFPAIDALGNLEGSEDWEPSYLLYRSVLSLVSILVATGSAAATGAVAGWFVTRSAGVAGNCAMIGAVYGLLIGMVGAVVSSSIAIELPTDMEGVERERGLPLGVYIAIVAVLDGGIKAGLTVPTFVWVRRRRRAGRPAPGG